MMKMMIRGRNDIRPPCGEASCAYALAMKKSRSSMGDLVDEMGFIVAANMGVRKRL
jgi:hypothetical protein